ncbi:MAG: substrate-binding domain-containing protein, partial [Sphaerochaetaceae bacterium]|jgi:DNA-binding LacI/PurR family transcriptional regulator/signal transduction histidine kinase|nr:substrate-binding domain-containing protein [Sphaerochaetaceae bacterium]
MTQQHRRCIGIFTASLDDGYQSTVWHAIEQEAHNRNFSTISFLGSRLGSPIASEASSNLAYHLASERNIDGLIIISSSLATFFTSRDLKDFFAPWESLPKVSVGMRIPGMSDITVEGSKGISELIDHLINVHGRTNFALIGGPEIHDEAISRKQAVVETLESHSLSLDPRLSFFGTFTQDSGVRAIETFIESGLPFDTVVCLNDRMAQGALDELAKRTIRVPDDVSVIGFDGLEASRFTQPPLTTVVQPLHDLGTSAVAILDRLMHKESEEHIVLTCSAVIRESCGCGPHFSFKSELKEFPRYASSSERQAIFDLMILVRKGDYEGMIVRLNKAIDTTIAESGVIDRWNEYLSIVENHCTQDDTPINPALATLMGAARAFTGEKIGRYQAAKRIMVETSFETLRHVSAMLAGTFELNEMFSNLKKSLRLFGINRGYLVGLMPNQKRARLLMNVEEDEQQWSHPPLEFNIAELLPSEKGQVWREGQWILMPLVYNAEQLGYLIVPIGMVIPALYDVLQEQISSNLKGTLLLEQIKSHEQTLSEQIALRTKDLIRTNRELSNEIKRRTELERDVMEISSKTMERIGQELHDDLCQHLLGISLLASSARKSVEEKRQDKSEILGQISHLLSESINKIKTISRGLLPLEMDAHTFRQRIEALVADTKRYARVDVEIDADADFEIIDADRSLHVFRIIQEALTNAVRHSKAKLVKISLRTQQDEDSRICRIASVTDNGVGLPERIRDGALGLRIMRNRASMAQAQLSVESSRCGTSVVIWLKEE